MQGDVKPPKKILATKKVLPPEKNPEGDFLFNLNNMKTPDHPLFTTAALMKSQQKSIPEIEIFSS